MGDSLRHRRTLGALHFPRQDTSGPPVSDYCHPTDLHDVPAGIEIYT